jgi:hypothetical protein
VGGRQLLAGDPAEDSAKVVKPRWGSSYRRQNELIYSKANLKNDGFAIALR